VISAIYSKAVVRRSFQRSLPLLRAEIHPLLPYLLTAGVSIVATVVLLQLQNRHPDSPQMLVLIGQVVLLSMLAVSFAAIALHPFSADRRADTLRQLLAQPESRIAMWFRKAGYSLLACLLVCAVGLISALFFFRNMPDSSRTSGAAEFVAGFLLIHALVLCSTGSVLSLYFKSGGGMLVLFGLVLLGWIGIWRYDLTIIAAVFLQLVQISPGREVLGFESATWATALCWSGAAWLLSLNLFKRLEV